jgi:hypothetical protein
MLIASDSDLMAFPVSLPNDGLIDIAIMANVGHMFISIRRSHSVPVTLVISG